jgi:hypothetical protein
MRQTSTWMIASTCALLAACATGVDSGDTGAAGTGDSGVGLEASPETASARDAGSSGGHDGATAQETSASTQDGGSMGDDASAADDAPTFEEAATSQDSANVLDTGTTSVPETGTTSGGICGSDPKYAIEAAAEALSGKITFCFSGVCDPGQCCYEELDPGNVCVAE